MEEFQQPGSFWKIKVGHGFKYKDGTEKKIYVPIYSIAFVLANWFAPKGTSVSRTTGPILIFGGQ